MKATCLFICRYSIKLENQSMRNVALHFVWQINTFSTPTRTPKLSRERFAVNIKWQTKWCTNANNFSDVKICSLLFLLAINVNFTGTEVRCHKIFTMHLTYLSSKCRQILLTYLLSQCKTYTMNIITPVIYWVSLIFTHIFFTAFSLTFTIVIKNNSWQSTIGVRLMKIRV